MKPRITFAVTAYREWERGDYAWIRQCLDAPSREPLVREILVYDDSVEGQRRTPAALADIPKVRYVRGLKNLGVFGAKIEAVSRSKGDWVITMDSDNWIEPVALCELATALRNVSPVNWVCPSFGMPAFDYSMHVGGHTQSNIAASIGRPMFECFLNTGNQSVYRRSFMEVMRPYRGQSAGDALRSLGLFAHENELANGARDSMLFNYLWLKAGRRLRCEANYRYHHRIDTGQLSNYNRAPETKMLVSEAILEAMRGMK